MLPFHMVVAANPFQAPLLRGLCALCVKIPIPFLCSASRNRPALSLFPATLTNTLPSKFFACRSYKNTGGGAPAPRIFTSLFLPSQAANPSRIRTYEKRACKSFTVRTYKTQDLKSFRIRTYKKTPGGRAPTAFVFACARNGRATSNCYPCRRSLLGMHLRKWRRGPCQNAWKVK
jgi:hypothetical protein